MSHLWSLLSLGLPRCQPLESSQSLALSLVWLCSRPCRGWPLQPLGRDAVFQVLGGEGGREGERERGREGEREA